MNIGIQYSKKKHAAFSLIYKSSINNFIQVSFSIFVKYLFSGAVVAHHNYHFSSLEM